MSEAFVFLETYWVTIFIILLLAITLLLYWKNISWIDRKIQKPLGTIILILLAIVFILLLAVTFECYFNKREVNLHNFLKIYGLFSQTTSAYSEINPETDSIFYIVVSIFGALIFSGLLVSAFSNVFNQRIFNVREGLVNYHVKNHAIIFGADKSLLTIINSIDLKRISKICIVTNKRPATLANLKNFINDNIWNRIYFYNADISAPFPFKKSDLKKRDGKILSYLTNFFITRDYISKNLKEHIFAKIKLEHCKEIYILGEENSSCQDIDNSLITTWIYNYLDIKLKRSKDYVIRCYVAIQNNSFIVKTLRSLERNREDKKENTVVNFASIGDCIQVVPFDINLCLASKVWGFQKDSKSKYKDLSVDDDNRCSISIVGFTDIAIGMLKMAIIKFHFGNNGQTIIKVYYTPDQYSKVCLFRTNYDLYSLTDIEVQFIEVQALPDFIGEYDQFQSLECQKSSEGVSKSVVLCCEDVDVNLQIAYRLLKFQNRPDILAYSDHVLNSCFTDDNQANNADNINIFGNLNQKIEFDILLNEYEIMYLSYLNSETNSIEFGVKNMGKDYFKYSYDNIKWRMSTLLESFFRMSETNGILCPDDDVIRNQQIAALILAGYTVQKDSVGIDDNAQFSHKTISSDKINIHNLKRILILADHNRLLYKLKGKNLGFPNLNSYGMYIIPVLNKFILYIPKAGVIAEIEEKEAEAFENSLAKGLVPYELKKWKDISMDLSIATPENIDSISILINQKCNFSCKYCYSANGRSNEELDEMLFPVIVDWFVTRERLEQCDSDHLSVTFSGGGDPTMSMDKLKKLATLLRIKANKLNVPIVIGLVCNGSRLRSTDIDFIAEYIDEMVISFDVLEDVHQKQRSHYNVVASTIRKLLAHNIKVGLRSTITALNVSRMCEMVETLHNDFCGCDCLAVEAVLSTELWQDKVELALFYNLFEKEFYKARKLAETYGISLGNTVEMSSVGLKNRSCPGKVVITPQGLLTACSRVATSGDSFFENFVFGKVEPTGLQYDKTKYEDIMSENSALHKECWACFARYHCGGGCMLARLSYNQEWFAIYCDFIRNMLKHKLFYELD